LKESVYSWLVSLMHYDLVSAQTEGNPHYFCRARCPIEGNEAIILLGRRTNPSAR
jgi:hypothetical protein